MPLLLTVRFVRDPAPERRRDAVEDFAQRHRAKSGFYDNAEAQRRDWRGDRFELATVGFGQLFERAVSEWLRELPELYLSRSPPVHGRLSDAFAVPLRRQCDELRSSCEHRVTRTTQSLRRRDTSRRVAPSPRRHLPPITLHRDAMVTPGTRPQETITIGRGASRSSDQCLDKGGNVVPDRRATRWRGSSDKRRPPSSRAQE